MECPIEKEAPMKLMNVGYQRKYLYDYVIICYVIIIGKE